MTTLPSRVLDYTIKLTTPMVATMPDLGRWCRMSRRQRRKNWSMGGGGCQVRARAIEIEHGVVLDDCLDDNVMKGQVK